MRKWKWRTYYQLKFKLQRTIKYYCSTYNFLFSYFSSEQIHSTSRISHFRLLRILFTEKKQKAKNRNKVTKRSLKRQNALNSGEGDENNTRNKQIKYKGKKEEKNSGSHE